MKKVTILISLFLSTMASWATSHTIYVDIENTMNIQRNDVPVVIALDPSMCPFDIKSATVFISEEEIPSQIDDLNNDRVPDELAFLINIAPGATTKARIVLSDTIAKRDRYTSRVYADMLVATKSKKRPHAPINSIESPTGDLYNYLHHHGPAFESELVAYRIYFDKKQTVDIYGKFNPGFEIAPSGWYPNDEQLAQGFGDDVLRVSGSCGVGTLKGWNLK